MKDIILLGGNILNRGFVEKKEYFGANRVIVFDWNEEPKVKGDLHFKIDIKDYKTILKILEDISSKDIIFAYTSADLGIKTVTEIHKKFGFKIPSDVSIENALIKSNMIKCWKEKNILNRKSFEIYCFENFNEYINKISTEKIIFKPNLSSGSRGISILGKKDSQNKIYKAFMNAKEVSLDNIVLLEEFIEGTEYTVEMLGDNYGNVEVWGISKKYHTPYNRHNKIAVKLHYNSQDVDNKLINKITEHAIKCYKALELKNSLGHLEVIVTKEGVVTPVEIGARSSGFIASHLIDVINNKSFLREYSKVIRGEKIKGGYTEKSPYSSMLYFYDIPTGTSKSNTNIMEFLPSKIESLSYDRDRLHSSEEFSVVNGDHERVGFEILKGLKCELTIENVVNAENDFLDKFVKNV